MRKTRKGRRRSAVVVVAGIVVAIATSVGCSAGSQNGGNDESSASGGSASESASSGNSASETSASSTDTSEAPVASHLPIAAPETCGDPIVFQKEDPDNVLSTLPADIQTWYEAYFNEVHGTPWTDWEGKEPPWKIGFINFPVDNPWQVGLTNQLKEEFAKAKAKGLVEGELQIYIQPDWATATPDQQIAAVGQMVRDGVDLILLHPLNEVAQRASIDAAGEAGVPIVTTSSHTGTEYAINVLTNTHTPSITEFLKLLKEENGWFNGETRYAVEVRGVQGNSFEQMIHDSWVKAAASCDIEIVGTVWGNWSPTTAKTEMIKFLTSYTGEIDFIAHGGAVAGGIIGAFETLGRPVPPMNFQGTTGGDLSWWHANKDTYETVGVQFSGAQVGYTTFDIAMRMLDGRGIRIQDVAAPGIMVTNDNIDQYATPGKELTWIGDVRGPVDGWLGGDPENLDVFFKEPGSPLDE